MADVELHASVLEIRFPVPHVPALRYLALFPGYTAYAHDGKVFQQVGAERQCRVVGVIVAEYGSLFVLWEDGESLRDVGVGRPGEGGGFGAAGWVREGETDVEDKAEEWGGG